jgi:alkylhydroperoxidase/carboxymuconolactone decarboxylase family protein YurZ
MPDENENTPVLDTLADMTTASLSNSSLEPRELMLARIAALAAMQAPPASWLLNAGTAADIGITLDDVQGVLVAVAPIIGSPRTMAAAGNITRALGFAIAVLDAELEAEVAEFEAAS